MTPPEAPHSDTVIVVLGHARQDVHLDPDFLAAGEPRAIPRPGRWRRRGVAPMFRWYSKSGA